MKKFTQSDINRIKQAQKLIQELKKKQSLIYNTLLVNLPTLKKEEECQIFNFVFNDYCHVLERPTSGDGERELTRQMTFEPLPACWFSDDLPKTNNTMKYEIELHKNEHKTIEVFAESPAAALKLAKDSNPGFKAECATEILGEDETGKCFEVVAHCEGCDRPIFDGEKYGSDEEGVSICADCLPSENLIMEN